MDGIINIYKPKGIGSTDVVRIIKKATKIKKVGHTGTLDPMAEGVLPICIGKGTKLVDYIMNGQKEYVVEFELGYETDSYDALGEITANYEVKVKKEEIVEAINSFKGDILQLPPMYSALKHNGKRLYQLARMGIEVEREARPISIYYLDILNIEEKVIKLKVGCSKGTYIRSLVFDIGRKLKTGATMTSLVRTKSSKFNVENSLSLENLTLNEIEKSIQSTESFFTNIPSIVLEDKYLNLLLNGVKVMDKRAIEGIPSIGNYRLYSNKKDFIGVITFNGEALQFTIRLI